MREATPRLYFAYGSNLWLAQMATRCPNSIYVGRAILPDYRWHINERGFANVVPASGFTVHGMVYELRGDDEARLDRSEGVSSGAYSKAYKAVILHGAPAALQMRTKWLIEDGGPTQVIETARRRAHPTYELEPYLQADVLVYLSEDFVRDGQPRDEYIDRMNYGIRDAIAVAIPSDFFKNTIRQSIPRRPAPNTTAQRVPRHQHRDTLQAPTSSRPRRSQSVRERAAPRIFERLHF
jgi:gamma-glutamylcyclotransferase